MLLVTFSRVKAVALVLIIAISANPRLNVKAAIKDFIKIHRIYATNVNQIVVSVLIVKLVLLVQLGTSLSVAHVMLVLNLVHNVSLSHNAHPVWLVDISNTSMESVQELVTDAKAHVNLAHLTLLHVHLVFKDTTYLHLDSVQSAVRAV